LKGFEDFEKYWKLNISNWLLSTNFMRFLGMNESASKVSVKRRYRRRRIDSEGQQW
jgi:hypothetical protein